MAQGRNVECENRFSWDQIHAGILAGILMDIRDELCKLNRLLGCPNFLDVPHILRRISQHTAKPKRKKRSK